MRGNLKAGGMRGRRPAKVEPTSLDLDKLGPDNLSLIRSSLFLTVD